MTSLACASPGSLDTAVTYNGFVFPNGTLTEAFSARPVKDAAERTIIYTAFRITVSCVISNSGASIDRRMQDAMVKLNAPAAPFSYAGRGLGGLTVNLPGGGSDCTWGPFPEEVSLKPYGGIAMKLTFTLAFNVPVQSAARFFGPMEYNYSVSVDIDKAGITRRRVHKGFLRLAQTRVAVNNRAVLGSADTWREKINPPLLEGFRRTPGQFETSFDKQRLDWTITDEEFEGDAVPPRDCIEAEAEFSYTTASPGRIFEWVGNLSAVYTCAKGNDLAVGSALTAFAKLARDRLGAFIDGNAGGFAGAFRRLTHKGIPATIIPMSFTVGDPSVYGAKRVRLEMRFRVAGASLAQILDGGGLWRPVPDSDWGIWSASIKENIGPRGGANLLLFTPGTEGIFDLGVPTPAAPAKVSNLKPPKPKKPKFKFVPANLPSLFPPPAAASSWMGYSTSVKVVEDSGTVVGSTLPISALASTVANGVGRWNAADEKLPTGTSTALALTPPSTSVSAGTAGTPFAQRRTAPKTYLVFSGFAVRAGHQIPVPSLLKYGGMDLVPVNTPDSGGFEQGVIAQGGLEGETPIYGANWSMTYLVVGGSKSSAVAAPPPNPILT